MSMFPLASPVASRVGTTVSVSTHTSGSPRPDQSQILAGSQHTVRDIMTAPECCSVQASTAILPKIGSDS